MFWFLDSIKSQRESPPYSMTESNHVEWWEKKKDHLADDERRKSLQSPVIPALRLVHTLFHWFWIFWWNSSSQLFEVHFFKNSNTKNNALNVAFYAARISLAGIKLAHLMPIQSIQLSRSLRMIRIPATMFRWNDSISRAHRQGNS